MCLLLTVGAINVRFRNIFEALARSQDYFITHYFSSKNEVQRHEKLCENAINQTQ